MSVVIPPGMHRAPDGATLSDDGNWWWDGSQWIAISVAIICAGCGAGQALLAADFGYTCSACFASYVLRACPKCSNPTYIGMVVARQPWVICKACGSTNTWAKWDKGLVTAGQMAAKTKVPPEAVGDADRRIIGGVIIAATGFPPLAQGVGCRLDFNGDQISVFALVEGGSYQRAAALSYSDARLLRIAGRGALTSTKGGGWMGGGFGVKGMVEGALLATALNAATRKTTASIETFVHFNAGSRELMMLNTEVRPEVLQVNLAPIFARLDAAHAGISVPAAQQDGLGLADLEKLAELRDKGIVTQAEFEAKKKQILDL